MRINKYLAMCGVASRRKSEDYVLAGRVRVGGRLVKDLSCEIDEKSDIVTLDGNRLSLPQSHIYLMLNKPKGCVCTASDDLGRKTVFDLLEDDMKSERLFSVGRLDYDTEGLLIITNDGDAANRIAHPRNEIEKTYIAKIEGSLSDAELESFRAGIIMDGSRTKKCRIALLDISEDKKTRYEVVISEGRNRQVRRMFEHFNRDVIFLKRTAIGPLRLGGLQRGKTRPLKEKEILYMKNM